MNSLADNMQPNGGTTSISKYSIEAIERLHECETDLDDARTTALRDLFTLDEREASVYVVLMNESLCKKWIQKHLGDMGFPSESHLVCSEAYFTFISDPILTLIQISISLTLSVESQR